MVRYEAKLRVFFGAPRKDGRVGVGDGGAQVTDPAATRRECVLLSGGIQGMLVLLFYSIAKTTMNTSAMRSKSSAIESIALKRTGGDEFSGFQLLQGHRI